MSFSESRIKLQKYIWCSKFHEAIKQGQIDRVRELIQNSDKLEYAASNQVSACTFAIQQKQLNIYEFLVSQRFKAFPQEECEQLKQNRFEQQEESNAQLHEAIRLGNFEEVQKLIPLGSQPFAFLNDVSACATAVKYQKLDIYELLVTKGFIFDSNEDIRKLTEEIQTLEKIRDINLKYVHSNNQHMKVLISHSRISKESIDFDLCFEKIEAAYNHLNIIEEVRPILQTVACAPKFEIIFCFEKSSISHTDPTATDCTYGRFDPGSKKILIGAKDLLDGDPVETYGTLAHELCHFASFLLYQNKEIPYSDNDKIRKKEYKEALDECNQLKSTEENIAEVFNKEDNDSILAELIVRVPQMIVKYKENLRIMICKLHFNKIFAFYRENFLSDIRNRISSLKEQLEIEEINELSGIFPKLKKFERKCKINRELRTFIFEKSKCNVISNSTFVTMLTIYEIFKNLENFPFNFIFIKIENYNNKEWFGKLKETLKNKIKPALVVDCDGITNSEEIENIFNECKKLENQIISVSKLSFFDAEIKVNHSLLDFQKTAKKKLIEDAKVNFQGKSCHLKYFLSKIDYLEIAHEIPVEDVLLGKEFVIGKEVVQDTEKFYITRKMKVKRTPDGSHFKKYKAISHFSVLDLSLNKKDSSDFSDSDSICLRSSDSESNSSSLESIDHKSEIFDPSNLKKDDTYSSKMFLTKPLLKQILILSDQAGMGKSTEFKMLLKSIKKKFPKFWVLYVDLKLHVESFKQIFTEFEDANKLISFINKKILNIERFEADAFKILFIKHQIIFLVDGFDEICPSAKDYVKLFFKSIKNLSQNCLWISTRPQYENELHEIFKTSICVELVPLTKDEQRTLFEKLLLEKGFEEEEIDQKVDKIMEAFTSSNQLYSDEDENLSNPLILRMVFELIVDCDKENFISTLENIDLYSFYDRFMDKMNQKMLTEKGNDAVHSGLKHMKTNFLINFMKFLTMISLKTFKLEEESKIFFEFDLDPQSLLDDVCRNGIIYRDPENGFQFTHRTFAEYFIAKFLFEQLFTDSIFSEKILERLTLVFSSIMKLESSKIIKMLDCAVNTKMQGDLKASFAQFVQYIAERDENIILMFLQKGTEYSSITKHFFSALKKSHVFMRRKLLLDSFKNFTSKYSEVSLSQTFFSFSTEVLQDVDLEQLVTQENFMKKIISSEVGRSDDTEILKHTFGFIEKCLWKSPSKISSLLRFSCLRNYETISSNALNELLEFMGIYINDYNIRLYLLENILKDDSIYKQLTHYDANIFFESIKKYLPTGFLIQFFLKRFFTSVSKDCRTKIILEISFSSEDSPRCLANIKNRFSSNVLLNFLVNRDFDSYLSVKKVYSDIMGHKLFDLLMPEIHHGSKQNIESYLKSLETYHCEKQILKLNQLNYFSTATLKQILKIKKITFTKVENLDSIETFLTLVKLSRWKDIKNLFSNKCFMNKISMDFKNNKIAKQQLLRAFEMTEFQKMMHLFFYNNKGIGMKILKFTPSFLLVDLNLKIFENKLSPSQMKSILSFYFLDENSEILQATKSTRKQNIQNFFELLKKQKVNQMEIRSLIMRKNEEKTFFNSAAFNCDRETIKTVFNYHKLYLEESDFKNLLLSELSSNPDMLLSNVNYDFIDFFLDIEDYFDSDGIKFILTILLQTVWERICLGNQVEIQSLILSNILTSNHIKSLNLKLKPLLIKVLKSIDSNSKRNFFLIYQITLNILECNLKSVDMFLQFFKLAIARTDNNQDCHHIEILFDYISTVRWVEIEILVENKVLSKMINSGLSKYQLAYMLKQFNKFYGNKIFELFIAASWKTIGVTSNRTIDFLRFLSGVSFSLTVKIIKIKDFNGSTVFNSIDELKHISDNLSKNLPEELTNFTYLVQIEQLRICSVEKNSLLKTFKKISDRFSNETIKKLLLSKLLNGQTILNSLFVSSEDNEFEEILRIYVRFFPGDEFTKILLSEDSYHGTLLIKLFQKDHVDFIARYGISLKSKDDKLLKSLISPKNLPLIVYEDSKSSQGSQIGANLCHLYKMCYDNEFYLEYVLDYLFENLSCMELETFAEFLSSDKQYLKSYLWHNVKKNDRNILQTALVKSLGIKIDDTKLFETLMRKYFTAIEKSQVSELLTSKDVLGWSCFHYLLKIGINSIEWLENLDTLVGKKFESHFLEFDKNGNNMLHFVCLECKFETLEIFFKFLNFESNLKLAKLLNSKNEFGKTSLQLIFENQNLNNQSIARAEIIQILLNMNMKFLTTKDWLKSLKEIVKYLDNFEFSLILFSFEAGLKQTPYQEQNFDHELPENSSQSQNYDKFNLKKYFVDKTEYFFEFSKENLMTVIQDCLNLLLKIKDEQGNSLFSLVLGSFEGLEKFQKLIELMKPRYLNKHLKEMFFSENKNHENPFHIAESSKFENPWDFYDLTKEILSKSEIRDLTMKTLGSGRNSVMISSSQGDVAMFWNYLEKNLSSEDQKAILLSKSNENKNILNYTSPKNFKFLYEKTCELEISDSFPFDNEILGKYLETYVYQDLKGRSMSCHYTQWEMNNILGELCSKSNIFETLTKLISDNSSVFEPCRECTHFWLVIISLALKNKSDLNCLNENWIQLLAENFDSEVFNLKVFGDKFKNVLRELVNFKNPEDSKTVLHYSLPNLNSKKSIVWASKYFLTAEKFEEFIKVIDSNGENFLFNAQCLDDACLLYNLPVHLIRDLALTRNNKNESFFYAFASKKYFLDEKAVRNFFECLNSYESRDLLLLQNLDGKTIFMIAAKNNCFENFWQTMNSYLTLRKQKKLLSTVDVEGSNLLHFAGASESLKNFEFIMKIFKKFFNDQEVLDLCSKSNIRGQNLVSMSETSEMLRMFFIKYPEMLGENKKSGKKRKLDEQLNTTSVAFKRRKTL